MHLPEAGISPLLTAAAIARALERARRQLPVGQWVGLVAEEYPNEK
jgi:hypothetical protein